MCKPVDGAERLCVPGGVIRSAAEQQAAWFRSIEPVRTPWFFWLDDDDDVPDDIGDVLAQCQNTEFDVAYTDELRVGSDGTHSVRRGAPYSREAHLRDPMMLHHLVLMRTNVAREVLPGLPRGHYWPEMMLTWALAARGAHYVPRIGYVWRRSAEGMSQQWWATHGMVRSQLWAKVNP